MRRQQQEVGCCRHVQEPREICTVHVRRQAVRFVEMEGDTDSGMPNMKMPPAIATQTTVDTRTRRWVAGGAARRCTMKVAEGNGTNGRV